MIDLEILKKSEYFEKISLESGDILFQEGSIDEYIYIIYKGALLIQKSILSQKGAFKTLGVLGKGNIIGEASLIHKKPKEVQILANSKTELLRIHAKNDFPHFNEKNPNDAFSLLINIIDITNTRLLQANREITANYEISRAISHIHHIDTHSIYQLLETIATILEIDQILYFEKNIVMDEYYKLKYNSGNEKKLQNTIIKFQNNSFDIPKARGEGIHIFEYVRNSALFLGEKNYGFLIIARKNKDFHENEEKLLQNIATSFVGVIHQKEIFEDEKNKISIKEHSKNF